MKKYISVLILISFLVITINSCGDDKKAITDFMPKLGSENLTSKTGYNIFNQSNIARNVKVNKVINRDLQANNEDKKLVVDILTRIKNIGIATKQEQNTIQTIIDNISSPSYASTINNVYSILKINNITINSKKEKIKVFMDKIKQDTYDENILKLKNVVDLSETINCDVNLNLSSAFIFNDAFFNSSNAKENIKKDTKLLEEKKKELSSLDSKSLEYEEDKQDLNENIQYLTEGIENIKSNLKEISKISIENALDNIYRIEFYECVTLEQLQFGGKVDTKLIQDKSFTTVEDNFNESIYKVSWLNKGKLSKDFFGDLTLRLNNYQNLSNNYEDFTRLDSEIVKNENKKFYSIFFKGNEADISQTFYNIELDSRTSLPKNQYIKFFKPFFSEGKKETHLSYFHFNSLGISVFSCSSVGGLDCNNNSNYNVDYVKLTSSDSFLRAKAKTSRINENDASKVFYASINKQSAENIGLIVDINQLQKKVSSISSSNMSNIFSKIAKEQDNSFYLDTLKY